MPASLHSLLKPAGGPVMPAVMPAVRGLTVTKCTTEDGGQARLHFKDSLKTPTHWGPGALCLEGAASGNGEQEGPGRSWDQSS